MTDRLPGVAFSLGKAECFSAALLGTAQNDQSVRDTGIGVVMNVTVDHLTETKLNEEATDTPNEKLAHSGYDTPEWLIVCSEVRCTTGASFHLGLDTFARRYSRAIHGSR